MTEILSKIAENLSLAFYFRQVFTILVLFLMGLVLLSFTDGNLFIKKKDGEADVLSLNHRFLLAFPVGMALFSACGLILLIFNVKYSALTVSIFMVIVVISKIITSKKYKQVLSDIKDNKKTIIIYSFIALVAMLIATSGLISIGFSNDSMYYYSAYPHEIVAKGYLHSGFDIFLTDAGQATALINTLPFLFGFNETFGLHTFFNMNFICFFFFVIYEKSDLYFERKISLIVSAVSTLFLVTTMPYVFVSKWILANMYFMGYAFILLYLNNRFSEDDASLYIRALLLLMLSFIRIEGALYAGLIMLVYMMQDNIRKKTVILTIVPTVLLQAFYYVRIFAFMNIKAVYSFMTWQKAVIAVTFLLMITLYSLIVSKDTKFPQIKERFKIINPVYVTFFGLILVNILLFIYDYRMFLSNVKVFTLNILKNSGWGFFAAVIAVMILLVPKVRIRTLYYEYFCLGFILVSFAACFARGAGLRVDLYDSSNRVMLQIVPFIVFALANRYIEAYGEKTSEG